MSTDPDDIDTEEDEECPCCGLCGVDCECVTCPDCEGKGWLEDPEGGTMCCEMCDDMGIVEGE